MNPHPMIIPVPRNWWFRYATKFTFATATGFGAAVGAVPATVASEPPAVPVASPPRISDVKLARAALAALDADPDLQGSTFLVSVVDRVAVLGGPVSHSRLAKRAEELVRGVPGILEVRNSCFVSPGPDPLLRAVADRLESSLPPRPTMFELPGVLTGAMTASPSFPVMDSVMAVVDKPEVVVARKPPSMPNVLEAPVAARNKATVPAAVPSATHAGILVTNRSTVLVAAEAIRKSETRFARLLIEERGGGLVISGSAPLAADAWDFARKLQTISGVARVAVGNVTGK